MKKKTSKTELLIFAGNPTQYHAPIYKALAKVRDINFTVLYGEKIGAKAFFNKEFNAIIDWEENLLEDYNYKFFKNLSNENRKGFWSRNNPKIFNYILHSNAKYVLIHGYDTLSSWYAYLASILSRKKIIWRGETIPKPKQKGYKRLKRILIEHIKKVVLSVYFKGCYKILYSCTLNKKYLSEFVTNKKKFVSFPCAVDNSFFKKYKTEDVNQIKEIKNNLSIKPNEIVITTCSRLTKRKKTNKIIEAISSSNFSSKIVLMIIGDGPEMKNLKKLANKLKVQTRFLGFLKQKELARYQSISNIFVLNSTYDASPKALNEALNYKQAIIVSQGVGTSIDLVKENKNGFITRNDNDLIDSINYLCKRPSNLLKMSEYNNKLLKQYSIDNDIKNLSEILC